MRKASQQPSDVGIVSAPHRGMVLGRYELIRPLGQGGMAQVWLARKRLPGGGTKVCALKMVLDMLSDNESQRNGLINEIKLSSVLSHSNIVQVYDAGIVGRVVFIEMERIDGVDLRQVLARLRLVAQPFSFELAALVARECLQGLYYAHTLEMDGRPAAVVHRDVSTSNILISSMGEVKIMDFGVGKFEADLTSGGNMLRGKLSYMAPEQLAGINTTKADIFALGAVFYEMLTCLSFREHATQQEAFAAAVGALVPDLDVPGLPPELLEFYRGCTERDHHRRFDAKAALAALKKWRALPADAADLQSLYARHIDGGRHSGYTQAEIALPPGYRALLEAIQAAASEAEHTGEYEGAGSGDSGPGRRVEVPRASAADGEVTRAEIVAPRVHPESEPDAPMVFRRPPSVRPTAPGTTVNIEGPPVAKRDVASARPAAAVAAPVVRDDVVVPVVAAPVVAAPVVALPAVAEPLVAVPGPEPIVDPKARTLQLEAEAPAPPMAATAVLSMSELLTAAPEGTTAAVAEPVLGEVTGVGPMHERGAAPMHEHHGAPRGELVESEDDGHLDVRRMLVVAAIAVGLGVAAVLWVLSGVPRPWATGATTASAKSESATGAGAEAEVPPSVEDEQDVEAKGERSGPVLLPRASEPVAPTGPSEPLLALGRAPGESEPTANTAAATSTPKPTSIPTATPSPTDGSDAIGKTPAAPEVEAPAAVVPTAPAKAAPKKPKSKPVPKVETRLAPNVEADVEIDGKVHALSLASKDVQLAVGKHTVRWRPRQETVWRDAAPLKLEAGMRYMLRIGPTSVKVTSSKAVTP